MPAIGATDPANLVAKARADLGFLWQLGQTRRIAPHPSRGGSSGYPVWYRQQQLTRFCAGMQIDVSVSTIYRWQKRLEPHCQNGNGPRTTIIGADLLNLVTFITAWPDAHLDEMACFIYNEGGNLYSTQAISKRLAELEITKKKASVEGYQTQQEDVQFQVWGFGIAHLPSAFLKCHGGNSSTLMNLECPWRSVIERGDGPSRCFVSGRMGTTTME